LIDGFEPPETASAPMFPDEVWDPIVDDFGETVDVKVFARAMAESSRAVGASDAVVASAEGATKTELDANAAASIQKIKAIPPPAPPPMPEEVPSKIRVDVVDVHLRAAVHACDYEGRSDGRSVKTLIQRVEPRRVVLVHGSETNTLHLRDSLRASLGPDVRVDAPRAGESVDCTSDTAMYKLELSQDLLQKTRLRDCAGYQVGWVDGVVGFAADASGRDVPVLLAPPKDSALTEMLDMGRAGDRDGDADGDTSPTTPSRRTETNFADVSMPLAAAAAAAAAAATATAASKERRRSAFVGDLKLTDFKIALATAGVSAEFRGGALVCAGGAVCVRKLADSENLQVEGALSEAFYRVRSILYASYQI
jgi:cleavage and polyadenylation specificity factor subunit 2